MIKKKYDLIIFDWDGTLIDSEAHIIGSMRKAIASQGLDIPSDDKIRHIIGLSLNRAIETLLPQSGQVEVGQIADSYRDFFFSDTELPHGKLFEGAEEVVRDLHAHGYYLAVATGKARRGLDLALKKTRLEPFFHITRCADETRSKPDPMMLDEILTDLDLQCERAVMVGDTSYDLDMANNIRMDSIAVTYGMHDRQHLGNYNPTYFIDAIEQLTQFV